MTVLIAKLTPFICTGLFITITAFGQIQKQSKTICAQDTRVIIIQSEGNCSLITSSTDTITIDAALSTSGTVYGLSKNYAPPFDIVTVQQGDTLFISSTPINKLVSIGISTYRENLEMQIAIPSSITNLQVESKYSLTAKLTQRHISSLKCCASHKLLVNNIEKAGEYEHGGSGTESIVLKGALIELYLDQSH
jgi:hypothetical protein